MGRTGPRFCQQCAKRLIQLSLQTIHLVLLFPWGTFGKCRQTLFCFATAVFAFLVRNPYVCFSVELCRVLIPWHLLWLLRVQLQCFRGVWFLSSVFLIERIPQISVLQSVKSFLISCLNLFIVSSCALAVFPALSFLLNNLHLLSSCSFNREQAHSLSSFVQLAFFHKIVDVIKGVGSFFSVQFDWQPELYTISWIADNLYDSISCFLVRC